jgi:hypothetical protein
MEYLNEKTKMEGWCNSSKSKLHTMDYLGIG